MKRLFWLTTGVVAGAWGYRYFVEEGGRVPGTEPLDERARKLNESARAFAESGRQLADEGRQFAQAARESAQTALDSAQERGREMMSKAGIRTGGLRGAAERMREEVRDGETAEGG